VRAIVVITGVAIIALLSTGNASSQEYSIHHPWIKKWRNYDRSAYAAIKPAAFIFKASPWTLRTIVELEGGNIVPWKLKRSLCTGSQPGWNRQGSYAFGPAQFMLDSKPACRHSWGTFGRWDDEAFIAAKKRGHPVPYRFKTPASNVGQMVVTAYMITHPHTGGIGHWCASMC
jgi:hypothetical protein